MWIEILSKDNVSARPIRSGEFAAVFKGRSKHSNECVAIKYPWHSLSGGVSTSTFAKKVSTRILNHNVAWLLLDLLPSIENIFRNCSMENLESPEYATVLGCQLEDTKRW